MSKIVPVNPAAKSADTLYYVLTGPKDGRLKVTYAGTTQPAQFTIEEAQRRCHDADYSQPSAPKVAEPKEAKRGDN